MSDVPPQHFYKILSYLPIAHTFMLECVSKTIQQKLINNPYYLNKRRNSDLNAEFSKTKEIIRNE